ncbi:MAG: ceramidase domain-containing protein, partial [Panacagrimonas sp.]
MSWLTSVDLYCERFDDGLFAEPLNAVSNLAFVAVGMALLIQLPRLFVPGRSPVVLEILSGLIVLIGICSGAFHVFAVRWAAALDVLSIALFIYTFVVCFAHYALSLRWGMAWIAAPVFWAFGVVVTAPFDPQAFNGSVDYLPALLGLSLMGMALAREHSAAARYFGAASG